MATITSDAHNRFLSRREVVCIFENMSGRLDKAQSVQTITEDLNLDKDKFVIPIKLQNQVGRPDVVGTFYVYDDERLARKHISPDVIKRSEKSSSKEISE